MRTVVFLFVFIWNISNILTAPPPLPSYDKQVNALLANMTDEEKVGQMVQIAINLIVKDTSKPWYEIEVDPVKLATAIQDYKVGSILNVVPGAYGIEQWHDIIGQIQDEAQKTRLSIPIIYGIDSIHGANYVQNSVLFPHATGLAATFNTSLVRAIAKISAHQTRAAALPWVFHPQVDIGRQKLWPRIWETYGEDVKLVKDMGRAYTEGLQGDNLTSNQNVGACLKHYVGYGLPLSGQDRTPAWIDERYMREYFLPPFEESVRAGAVSVMVCSGEVNGIPGHANYHLLTEMLKQTYQFEGFTVSDWEDIERLNYRDHVAETPQEAVRQAVMAGIDMSMVPSDFSFYNLTLACVKDGSIPRTRLDDAVRRILRVKFALGLFDGRTAWPNSSAINDFNRPEFYVTQLEAARQVMTLLKNNDNVLPLDINKITETNKLIITGPTANILSSLHGGWSYTWSGHDPGIYPQNLTNKTILESFRTRLGSEKIDYFNGSSFNQLYNIDSLLNASETASYILVCLGEQSYTETPGNINELTLDDAQLELVERIKNRTKVPIIVALAQGRPRLIRRIVDISSAIIMMFLPGTEGGQALVDVVFGDYNPSGRLSITYPKYEHRLSTYDYKWTEVQLGNSIDVEFEFGHGLSYTTFVYSNLYVPPTLKWNDQLNITLNVRNSGSRQGDHTVILFVTDVYRSITPPNKELKGYSKISLNPGEQQQVQFSLTQNDLSFISLNYTRITEPGLFIITVGDLQARFTLLAADQSST